MIFQGGGGGGAGPPVAPSGSALGMPQSNKFNPFKPNRISHSHKLDQSISVLRVAGWYFFLIFTED